MDEKIIFIFSDIHNLLSNEELYSVLLHEDGHIQLGHHDPAGANLSHMERESVRLMRGRLPTLVLK